MVCPDAVQDVHVVDAAQLGSHHRCRRRVCNFSDYSFHIEHAICVSAELLEYFVRGRGYITRSGVGEMSARRAESSFDILAAQNEDPGEEIRRHRH